MITAGNFPVAVPSWKIIPALLCGNAAILKAADPAQLRREALGWIARIQLAEQSRAYRGELVTTRGVIRRAHWLEAPKNN